MLTWSGSWEQALRAKERVKELGRRSKRRRREKSEREEAGEEERVLRWEFQWEISGDEEWRRKIWRA